VPGRDRDGRVEPGAREGLVRGEPPGCIEIGRAEDVDAAGVRGAVGRERRAPRHQLLGEAIHVGPVRLAELVQSRIDAVLVDAVHEELHARSSTVGPRAGSVVLR
jgi:hypothetical protein